MKTLLRVRCTRPILLIFPGKSYLGLAGPYPGKSYLGLAGRYPGESYLGLAGRYPGESSPGVVVFDNLPVGLLR